MPDTPNPHDQAQPTEPAPEDEPEKRIRRGCLMIILLLLIGIVFNFLQYGVNIVAIAMTALLVVAIVGLVLVSREQKAR